MPYGLTEPGQVTAPVGPPPAVVEHAGAAANPGLPHPQQLGAGTLDLWRHVTLVPASLPRMVRSEVAATKLVLLEQDFERVYVTLGREASSEPGTYDLVHPGGGFLTFAIPPTTELGVMYAAGASPTLPLELWLLAGPSAVR